MVIPGSSGPIGIRVRYQILLLGLLSPEEIGLACPEKICLACAEKRFPGLYLYPQCRRGDIFEGFLHPGYGGRVGAG